MEQQIHREMTELRGSVATLGGLVESCIGKAIISVKTNDTRLVDQVCAEESLTDSQEVDIEEHCLKILALYQPVAKDLRLIVTTLKIINELEKMGDLAKKIAKKAGRIPKSLFDDSHLNLSDLGAKVISMVSLSLDAFLHEDVAIAKSILELEDEVDSIHEGNHKRIAKLIDHHELEFTEAELVLLSISRSLERIGDLATKIAEDVIYLVEAKIVRHNWEDV